MSSTDPLEPLPTAPTGLAGSTIAGAANAGPRRDHAATIGPVASSLARLRPRTTATELLAHGAIFSSCACYLQQFCNLHRARRSVVMQACLELRLAVQHAAAITACSEQAVRVAVALWSEQLDRLAAIRGVAADELQLLADLKRACASAKPDDPYTPIFKIVAARAQALYDGDWPQVEFVVRLFSAPRPGEHRYPIRATTQLAAARSPTTVVLTIDPIEFIPDAFAAIPALLVHECVCHVPARPIEDVDNLSAFAEGFMDWVATYYRQLWLASLGSLTAAAKEHAPLVFDEIARTNPDLGSVRGVGQRAAGKVAQRLDLRHGMRETAAAATANLGRRLNVVDAPLWHKDMLVRELDRQADDSPLSSAVLQVIKGSRPPSDLL
jgi:hypothetical protein